MFSDIQNVLAEAVQTNFAAGVNCLVIKDGKELCYAQAGLADVEKQVPIRRDTIFRLYSLTKPFTAAAVMKLLSEGKIDLLDPVAKFLPAFWDQKVWEGETLVPANRPVQILDLLSMRAGITYSGLWCPTELAMEDLLNEAKARMGTDNEMTTRELADRIGQTPLAFQPGERWHYSLCADVLGAVIEVVSGMSLGEYFRKNFFEPLEMKDTGFFVPAKNQHRLAKVYRTTEENTLELYTHDNLGIQNKMDHAPAYESGGAGLVSTIDDVSHFAQMLLDGGMYKGKEILPAGAIAFMTTPQLTKAQAAAMGWESLQGYSYGNLLRILTEAEQMTGLGSLGEYGWDGWLGAYLCNDPAHHLTILMMHQKVDSGTTTYTRRVRNVVFARQ